MIDTANISARVGALNRSYVDRLYDEAERIRQAMEEESLPAIIDMFERQLEEIEAKIEALEDDQVVQEDDLLDFIFWFAETYAILSVFLRRWVIIGWRFGSDVTGANLPALLQDDPRVTSFLEQMRQNNDNITANTKEEVRTYLDSVGATFGRDMKQRTKEVIWHFRQYFERRGTSIAEMNANAALLRGYLSAMIAAGVQRKQWVSQRDTRVRKSHVDADGQIVPIRAPFIVGGAPLLHPVDPKGPPQEILRCRCFMVPVVPGFAFPEGPQPNVGS